MTDTEARPTRRVVCAANRKGGTLIVGPRHCDRVMHATREALGIPDFHGWEQGFIDQWGDFMTREEALNVARDAGQLAGREKTNPKNILFSEDLY